MKLSARRAFTFLLLAGCAQTAVAQVTASYVYDSLGRVTQVTATNGDVTTYTYDAADNRTQKVTVSAPPPSAPTVANVSASIPHNTATGVALSVTGSYTSIAVGTGPSHGSVTISGATATYTPTTSYSGADSFTYTATNSAGISAPATVSLTVAAAAFTQTIQITGTGPAELRALANTAGYSGAQNATLTFEVGNGVTITGDPGGGIGVDTGTWPSGYTLNLTLVVKSGGKIYGGGGAGGAGGALGSNYGATGSAGGDAVYVQTPLSITVQSGGLIAGGGNGGTGGRGDDYWDPYTYDYFYNGGGGGGGGFPNGPGGAGGYLLDWMYYLGYEGNAGQDGTTSGGGAGGAALPASLSYDAAGSTGGAAGGGNAIRKNGHTVPVSNSGTITGAQ